MEEEKLKKIVIEILNEVEKRKNVHFSTKPFFKTVSSIVGLIASLSFAITLILNWNNVTQYLKGEKNSDVIISSCMSKYSQISQDLRKFNNNSSDSLVDLNNLVYSYLDLTNEELFYIRNKVVAKEVAFDWLTGTIKQIKKFKEIQATDIDNIISVDFPRIKETFRRVVWTNVESNNISKKTIEECIEDLSTYNSNQ